MSCLAGLGRNKKLYTRILIHAVWYTAGMGPESIRSALTYPSNTLTKTLAYTSSKSSSLTVSIASKASIISLAL